jgi:hypothetical protein
MYTRPQNGKTVNAFTVARLDESTSFLILVRDIGEIFVL